jgi:hypothetical protein
MQTWVTEIWTDCPIPNSRGHDTGGGLCVMNSRSDDHSTVARLYVFRRVLSRLNSEFCIPSFWGFDSGLNNKSTSERERENQHYLFVFHNTGVFLPHREKKKSVSYFPCYFSRILPISGSKGVRIFFPLRTRKSGDPGIRGKKVRNRGLKMQNSS